MGKPKYKLSDKERKNKANLVTRQLAKVDDIPTVQEIIKNDEMYVKVAFVSKLMVRNMTIQQMCERYEQEYGEKISAYKMTKLRNAARMVYISQIAHEREELVAEELMRAEWEAQELMNAWDNSKQGAIKKSKHKAKSEGTELTTYDLEEETEDTTTSYGDVRYMERLDKVRQRVINLLGLEAPKQAAQQQSNTLPSVTINVVGRQQPNLNVQDVELVNE